MIVFDRDCNFAIDSGSNCEESDCYLAVRTILADDYQSYRYYPPGDVMKVGLLNVSQNDVTKISHLETVDDLQLAARRLLLLAHRHHAPHVGDE